MKLILIQYPLNLDTVLIQYLYSMDTQSQQEQEQEQEEEEEQEGDTQPKNLLLNSNLFSQPNIPDLQTVKFEFHQAGGNEEMAIAFFDKYTATGWMIKSSPIKVFKSLIPSFITNWKKFEKNGTDQPNNSGSPKLGTSAARIAALRNW